MRLDIIQPVREFDEPNQTDRRPQIRAQKSAAPPKDRARTLEEIGTEMGITRERVRQIEARALKKARVILARYGYRLEDLIS